MERQDRASWEHIEQRFQELFPDGLTQDEIDKANEVIWRHAYPTKQMADEDEQEQQDLLQPEQPYGRMRAYHVVTYSRGEN